MREPSTMNVFSTEDIIDAIAKTNFHKGLGPDHFNGQSLSQNEALRYKVARELCEMLNRGSIPNYLRDARVVALSKLRGESRVQDDDIRFIALRSHLSKILEKAIIAKLKLTKSDLLAVQSYQRGFKEGASTMENIAIALNALHAKNGTKKKKFLLFADLTKAFNSINRGKLFEILCKCA